MDFDVRIDEKAIKDFIDGLKASREATANDEAALGCSEDFAEYLRLARIGGDAYITNPEVFANVCLHIRQFFVTNLLTASFFLGKQITKATTRSRRSPGRHAGHSIDAGHERHAHRHCPQRQDRMRLMPDGPEKGPSHASAARRHGVTDVSV